MSNEIVDAVRARGYLQGEPREQAALQVVKALEEACELAHAAGMAVTADANYLQRIAETRDPGLRDEWAWLVARLQAVSRELFRRGVNDVNARFRVGWTARQIKAARNEAADVEVTLQCLWGVWSEIDGQDFPIVAAARDKAIGDIVRGVTR